MNRSALKSFFDIILKGESRSYDDYNYYTSSGLRSYLKNVSGKPYSLLQKDLSKYSIYEIIKFQSHQRDSIGQLYATGRYQIIPTTLKGLLKTSSVKESDIYSEYNQDLLGYELLKIRSNLNKYIHGLVPDTIENLQKAALDMAKTWSSIGVPFPVQGSHRFLNTNQSFYTGGGDKASVKTESVQKALKQLRQDLSQNNSGATGSIIKDNLFFFGIVAAITIYLMYARKHTH